jgi:hypothetical protein
MRATAGVYTPLGLDEFELCHPVDGTDFEEIAVTINGMPRQSSWKPMSMQLVRSDQGQDLL